MCPILFTSSTPPFKNFKNRPKKPPQGYGHFLKFETSAVSHPKSLIFWIPIVWYRFRGGEIIWNTLYIEFSSKIRVELLLTKNYFQFCSDFWVTAVDPKLIQILLNSFIIRIPSGPFEFFRVLFDVSRVLTNSYWCKQRVQFAVCFFTGFRRILTRGAPQCVVHF